MRAHLFRPLQDTAGNLQRGATVRVYEPGTADLADGNLYVSGDEANFETYGQPVACPNGFVSIYFTSPKRVRLGVTPFGGGTEVFFDDIDAFVPRVSAEDVGINLSSINSFDVRSAIAEIMGFKYGPDNPPPVGTSNTATGTFNTGYGWLSEAPNVQVALNTLVDYKYGPDVPEAFRLHADPVDLTLDPYDKVVFCTGSPVTVTLPVLTNDPPPPAPPPPDTTTDSDGDGTPDYLDPDYVPPPAPPPTFVRRDIGRQYVIKNLNAAPLTVAAPGTTLIDGDSTRLLAQYDVLHVVWTGATWGVI